VSAMMDRTVTKIPQVRHGLTVHRQRTFVALFVAPESSHVQHASLGTSCFLEPAARDSGLVSSLHLCYVAFWLSTLG
jgi:hypothetical protein